MVHLNVDEMNAMQLACKMGLRRMFQHTLKNEHTKVLWKWGPLSAYQLSLEGVDSSGSGAADIMEILARQDASRVTQTFILDDMMEGFLFTLAQQKWQRFAWKVHVMWRGFDFLVIVYSRFKRIVIPGRL